MSNSASQAHDNIIDDQGDAVDDLVDAVENRVNTLIRIATTRFQRDTRQMDTDIRNKLAFLKRQWIVNETTTMPASSTSMRDSAMVRQSREWVTLLQSQNLQMGKAMDVANRSVTARELQKIEHEIQQRLTPSENMCVADTANTALLRATEISRAARTGFARTMTDRAANRTGTLGQLGPEADYRLRWGQFTRNFCDAAANNGNIPDCQPGTAQYANYDIEVGKALFSRETIPADPVAKLAAESYVRYIAEPAILQPLDLDLTRTPEGNVELLGRRAYLARRNLVYNWFGEMLAERTGGGEHSDFQDNISNLRMQSGISPFEVGENPGRRETLTAMTRDRIMDPAYFMTLGETPENALRESVFLKSYALMQMNELVKKSDQTAAILATQLAVMMDKAAFGGGRASRR